MHSERSRHFRVLLFAATPIDRNRDERLLAFLVQGVLAGKYKVIMSKINEMTSSDAIDVTRILAFLKLIVSTAHRGNKR